MAKLTIEVSADELEKALQNAYKKQKNKISMPGFRKGKVPRQMVEKMYGADVFYEDAANALIPQAYSEAYDECDLQIVSQRRLILHRSRKENRSSSQHLLLQDRRLLLESTKDLR